MLPLHITILVLWTYYTTRLPMRAVGVFNYTSFMKCPHVTQGVLQVFHMENAQKIHLINLHPPNMGNISPVTTQQLA